MVTDLGPLAPRRHDPVTVLAIAALVYVLAIVTHEGLGHAVTCVAVGGVLRGVSSSWCDCAADALSPWAGRAVNAAGTLANLAIAALMLGVQRWRAPATGPLAYFVWLTFTVNGLMGAGYLMVDPIFGFGDWTAFLAGLSGTGAFRVLLSAIGLGLTMLGFRRASQTLIPFVGTAPLQALPGARLLCWVPWAGAGGLLLTGGAALNQHGLRFAFTSALATLGGTWMLVWIPSTFRRQRPQLLEPTLVIGRSSGFVAGGMAATAFLLTFFGPGITSGRG
jgi:hypothetical protein